VASSCNHDSDLHVPCNAGNFFSVAAEQNFEHSYKYGSNVAKCQAVEQSGAEVRSEMYHLTIHSVAGLTTGP
jgi:hypothetical protein